MASSTADAQEISTVPAIPAGQSAARRAIRTLDQLARLSELLAATDGGPMRPPGYAVPSGFKLSVIIPVYNERNTVLQVLAQVRRLPVPKEIIVVDDGSTDGTRCVLEALRGAPDVKLVFQPRNLGKGAAVRAGLAQAAGDVVVVQDADLEYDPRDILKVIEPIVAGRADVVYGSRYLADSADRSLLHRCVNRALTETSNLFTGLRLTDMETCYKAFRRQVLASLPLRQNRFGFEPEVTAKLARRQYRIVERPISYRARGYADGKKIGLRDAVNALYCIIRYGLAD